MPFFIQASTADSGDGTWTDTSTLSGISVLPDKVLLIKPSGTQTNYDSIALAMAAATASDLAVVGPGRFTENVVIPDDVTLVGAYARETAVIEGTVVLGDLAQIENIEVDCAINGADCISYAGATLAVARNVIVRSSSGTPTNAFANNSTGSLTVYACVLATGTWDDAVHCPSGRIRVFDLVCVRPTLNRVFHAAGGILEVLGTEVYDTVTVTDTIYVEGGSFRSDGVNVTNAINAALNIQVDGVTLQISGGTLQGATYDVFVNPALTGTGTTVVAQGVRTRRERLSAPAGWLTTAEVTTLQFDDGVQDDSGVKVLGDFVVGAAGSGNELVAGEGDSSTRDMVSFSYANTEAVYTDITTELKSSTGSVVDLFGGTDANSAWYIGNTGRTFPGVKVDSTSAMVLGAGAVVWEYWNGAAWTAFNVLFTDSNAPYAQYGNAPFSTGASQQIRFDNDNMTGFATTAVNGTTAYWVRCRATVGFTTSPTAQRTKIGTNRTEINKDGFMEFFGAAEPERPLLTHQRLTDDLSGLSPGNVTINMTANIAITPIDNQFTSSAVDGFGWIRRVPVGSQTAKEITFRALFLPSNTDTGNMLFRFRYGTAQLGDLLNGSRTETTLTQLVAGGGVRDALQEVVFTFAVPEAVPGDVQSFSFERVGNDGTDTFTGNTEIVMIEATGSFWR